MKTRQQDERLDSEKTHFDFVRRIGSYMASLALAWAAFAVSPASAITVPITNGFIYIDSSNFGRVELSGEGVAVTGTIMDAGGVRLCQVCWEGTNTLESWILIPSDFRGSVSWLGSTYNVSTTPLSPWGILGLEGSWELPSDPSVRSVEAPFTFTGGLNGVRGAPLDLIGSGTARIQFDGFFQGMYRRASVRYDFTPVPEPSTLTLLLTGTLAWAAWKRSR